MAEALRMLVKQTVARGGKVLVPAFSLGRSQLVVHFLQQMMTRGQLPAVPIYVDSPLAIDVAGVYREHSDYLSTDTVHQLHEPSNFLNGPQIHYLRTTDESKEVNHRQEPCVIVASSGMVEGGRILHHLKHHVDDPRCTVVLVSYQAPDSIGARLLERKPTVRFMGRDWNKWADVVLLKGFSGHADQHELLAHLRPLAGRARAVRLVHGEPPSAEALAGVLRGAGFGDVGLAERGEPMALLP
jgi:metallo-beta-lactamase family protein